MLLKFGTDVVTYDDQKIGELESVIVEPATEEITHLVVRKGGVLNTEDKLVPISLVAQSDKTQIKLHEFEGDVDDLQNYQTSMFVPLDNYINDDLEGEVIPLVFYPPLSSPRAYSAHLTGMPVIKKELPGDEEALREGAEVVGMEGKKLGQVKEVILDPKTDRVTQLLVKEGVLFKKEYLIPVEWVRSIEENEVDLYVNQNLIENLPSHNKAGA
ncbi:MAG: PRC-barrel domain-containing protein [Anaerolineales bacterium]